MAEFLLIMLPAMVNFAWLSDQRRPVRARGAWFLVVVWHYLLLAAACSLGLSLPDSNSHSVASAGALGYPVPACIVFALVLGGAVHILPSPVGWAVWLFTVATGVWWGSGEIHGAADSLLMLGLMVGSALGHALGRWTAEQTHLWSRSALQALLWLTLLGWHLPALILAGTHQLWPPIGDLWGAALLLLIVPGLLMGAAIYQFAEEGGGTAFPYDPPVRLVVGGIYAHLRNPMQLGVCLGLAAWGIVLDRPLVVASALVAVQLFIVFKRICNGASRIGEDPAWRDYRRRVPVWWPAWRAYRPDRTPLSHSGASSCPSPVRASVAR